MYRVAMAFVLVLGVAPDAIAQTASFCARIAEAETLGIVAEPGMTAALTEKWQMTGIEGPVVTYFPRDVQSGDTVAALVREGGFRPDQNNIALMKALNPGKTDLNMLSVGDALNVPAVSRTGSEGTGIDGYRTWANLQGALAAEAGRQDAMAKMEAVGVTLETLGSSESVTGPIRRDIAAIGDLINSPVVVQPDGAIDVEQFVRLEQKSGAYQAAEYVSGLFRGDQIAQYPPEQIAAITDAVATQVAALGIGRAELVVRTYSPAKQELTELRVYRVTEASYRYKCLDENKIEFDTRSFEARALLRMGKWWYWAENAEGRKSKPKSVELHSVGKNTDYTIEWAD